MGIQNNSNTLNINTNNKGNWEFSFFQKKYDPILESNIKQSMKPDNCFNPKLIHYYINPITPKEEILLKKKNTGQILKSNETIILNNYIHYHHYNPYHP